MNKASGAGTLNTGALREMLSMQADMNARVNPAWLTAGYQYLRAAAIEGAEALDHAGWKWWKKQDRDLGQLRMELVDIWHFALSDAWVLSEGDREAAAEWLLWDLTDAGRNHVHFDSEAYFLDQMDMLSRIELLIGLAVVRRFDTALFETLLSDCGMTWDGLYRSYVGKNVLNFFRQDNGYKEGTYRKVWDDREDNVHLAEILAGLDSEDASFRENLYNALEARYVVTANWAA